MRSRALTGGLPAGRGRVMWSRGDTVALRDIWFGEVWRAVPAIVVADTPEATAVFVPPGCESVYPADDHGDEIRLPAPGATRPTRNTTEGVLVLYEPPAAW